MEGARKGERLHISAYFNGKLIANAGARRGLYKERNNVAVGISVLKQFRGTGLAKLLLSEVISQVKKTMKPRNIYLDVYENNMRARKLYESLGFKKIAKLPNWVKHKGKYQDKAIMLLK